VLSYPRGPEWHPTGQTLVTGLVRVRPLVLALCLSIQCAVCPDYPDRSIRLLSGLALISGALPWSNDI
jgi:hypothetical protein